MKKPIVAICYDFDSTLATSDMQNFGFIPALGLTPAEFWSKTGRFSKKFDVERTLSYLFVMKNECEKRGIRMTREYLNSMGKDIKYFDGVKNWFSRINAYGEELGIKVEHYLISSGNAEIVEGCAIYKEFRKVYASEYVYDSTTHLPIWPKLAINHTQKTQYFFRISKGVYNANDDEKLNEKTVDRRIPYRNMIYIGDGMTDIPAMVIAKNNGGKSIAVYPKGNEEKVRYLHEDGRVNYVCPADYSEGHELDKVMKLIIQGIHISENLDLREIPKADSSKPEAPKAEED